MRTSLRALLLILTLILAVSPVLSTTSIVTTVVAGDDNDKGKGNDDDKDDKGNNGNGGNKDNKDKKEKKQVEATDDYTIEIACEPAADDGDEGGDGESGDDGDDGGESDDDDNEGDGGDDDAEEGDDGASTTACTVTAVTPAGSKKVTHVLIPAEVACADASGDVKWVDDDPNIHRAGYRHEGQKPFTVVFDDVVTTSGTATYWVKAADRVLPATGPGLECAATAEATAPEPTATSPAGPTEAGGTLEPTVQAPAEPTTAPTEPPAPTTGTILVTTYTCGAMRAGMTNVDWFGACTQGGASTFTLAGGSDSLSMDTAADGTATFADLAPSTYDLDDASRVWCHAESDNVDTGGNVIVEAGVTTNVWLFYCG